VDISKQAQLYLESVSANDKKLSDINMQVAVMDQLEKSATSPAKCRDVAFHAGVTDPTLTQQMNNLSALQLQYDKLKTTVPENHPMLVSLTEQINRIKPAILNNIQSQRISLEQSKSSLSSTGGTYTAMLSNIPQKERQIIEISRDQNIKNGIYSFLLQKKRGKRTFLCIYDPRQQSGELCSIYEEPVSPKKIIILFVAVALAMGFPRSDHYRQGNPQP
jgi:uncharacterized protein involved in exopolysaccharide biosynthesis